MSVKKGMVPIKDKEYNDPKRDWNKLTKTFPELVEFDTYIGKNLLSTNVAIIKHIMNKMNIDTVFKMDWFTHLKGTHRLVDICVQLGADQYLAGALGMYLTYINLFVFILRLMIALQGGGRRD